MLPVSADLGPELSALRSRAAAANVQRVPGRAPSQAGPAAPPSSRYRDSTASARGSCQSVLRSPAGVQPATLALRSEEHTSELQSLMRISYAVFCLKKKKSNISQ